MTNDDPVKGGVRIMLITKEMGIKECVQKYPKTAAVFMEFAGCLGCAAAAF